jgi:biotin transport system substrate-specific component
MQKREEVFEMKSLYLQRLALIFSFTILLALLSQIRIPLPFTPVPLTLQTLGILFIGYYLGAKLGFLSVAFYLVLGALGLPFFSGVKGGLLVLSGPTGGYLFGFLLSVFLVGKAKERGLLTKAGSTFLVAFLAHFIIYFFGTLWFMAGFYFLGFKETLREILALTVFPFLPVDLIKALIFTGLVFSERKFRKVGSR